MGKSWTTRRRGDERAFLNSLRKGTTVYVINTPQHAGKAHLWNHAQTWSSHTVTGKHPILGGWIFDNSPSLGAKSLFQWAGTVYDSRPVGIPHASDPGPDIRDEGLYGIRRGEEIRFEGSMGDAIKQAEYLTDQAEDRAKADKKSGARKGWW